MDMEQLRRMREDKGFLAALDQSGGSTPKALLQYGIPENAYTNEDGMYDLVHAMRTRLITNPAFDSTYILGAILFENTMRRTIDGEPVPDYLWNRKKIVPFLKIDKGLAAARNGVQLMKPMPDLDSLLKEAVKRHIFGTKMRSFIQEANAGGIAEVVAQQFDVARRIMEAGLVPIIEPEVDIRSIDRYDSEMMLKREIRKQLSGLDPASKLMLKLSIPAKDDFYSDLMDDPRVVRIVALSGGYSQTEANERLARNTGLIASFSRALAAGLNAHQSDGEFNNTLESSVKAIYDASVNKR